MLSGINPFKVRNKNKFEKLQMILEDTIEMQPHFSEEACSLIEGLLTKKVLSSFLFNQLWILAEGQTGVQRESGNKGPHFFRRYRLGKAGKETGVATLCT
jgi:hypothetical protein